MDTHEKTLSAAIPLKFTGLIGRLDVKNPEISEQTFSPPGKTMRLIRAPVSLRLI